MLEGMRASELIDQHCSIARPATLLGDRWTLVILRQAFSRTRRFEDFQRELGISRSLLSDRLGKLVEAGILRREPYKDEVRTREEYRLTEKGLDLYPVLMALREWGDKHMAPEGAPLVVHHRGCGGEVRTALRCESCGEEVGARDAEVAVGPGLKHLASA
jgi:DNA-binding HxlR family transcriptional regulator